MVEKCRIMVMASGNGSNFQAICDGIADGRIPNATICRLIINRGRAYAARRAELRGIPWENFNLITHGFQEKGEDCPHKLKRARDEYDVALAHKILTSKPRPNLIVLAGWMYVFGDFFLDPIAKAGIKIINLHPALPGMYDGANAIERAYEDFKAGKLTDNKTGIMVHNVIKQVDQGEAIMTREVQCLPDDSLEELKERIRALEHELIVKATARVVADIVGA